MKKLLILMILFPLVCFGQTRPHYTQIEAAPFAGARNVRAYGAVGDGITDDTAAIQSAMSPSPGAIYFPPGDYRITDTIMVGTQKTLYGPVPNNYRVSGARITAHIDDLGDKPMFQMTASGTSTTQTIRVENLRFQGLGTDDTVDAGPIGLQISGVKEGIHIVGCSFRGLRQGIRADAGADGNSYTGHTVIDRCNFLNNHLAIKANSTVPVNITNSNFQFCHFWIIGNQLNIDGNVFNHNTSVARTDGPNIQVSRRALVNNNFFEGSNSVIELGLGAQLTATNNYFGASNNTGTSSRYQIVVNRGNRITLKNNFFSPQTRLFRYAPGLSLDDHKTIKVRMHGNHAGITTWRPDNESGKQYLWDVEASGNFRSITDLGEPEEFFRDIESSAVKVRGSSIITPNATYTIDLGLADGQMLENNSGRYSVTLKTDGNAGGTFVVELRGIGARAVMNGKLRATSWSGASSNNRARFHEYIIVGGADGENSSFTATSTYEIAASFTSGGTTTSTLSVSTDYVWDSEGEVGSLFITIVAGGTNADTHPKIFSLDFDYLRR